MAQQEPDRSAAAQEEDVLEREIRIAARPETVFAFFTDPANETRWRGSHVREFSPEGPTAPGTRIRQVVAGPMGRGIDADIEITRVEPDVRYGFRGVAGPIRPVGEYTFRPVDDGTEVTFTLDVPVSGVKKVVMGGAVRKALDSEVAALDTAKEILES